MAVFAICECCWELNREEIAATCWMEWGEWLCAECAAQAVEGDGEDRPDEPSSAHISQES